MISSDSENSMCMIHTEQQVSQPKTNGDNGNNDAFPFIVFGMPIVIVFVSTWMKYNYGGLLNHRDFSKLVFDICIDKEIGDGS